MKQRIVAGNWKMHTNRSEALELVMGILDGVGSRTLPKSLDIVVCPPFVWIEHIISSLNGGTAPQRTSSSPIVCGAQDCHHELKGAYTGDISAPMIADLGCRYVIVGHSERRQHHGETNERIAQKVVAAREAGLRPIVCVGETAQERAEGRTADVVGQQIDAILAGAGSAVMNESVVAYEPLWAIGTGVAASPEQAQEVHAMIRARLNQHGAPATALLYGGSVNASNAASFFACPDVDGALVGGASLAADTFLSIINAACAAWSE